MAGEVEPGGRVLELGPGTGIVTQALLERGAKLTAVEFDAPFAKVLRERFPGVRVIEGNAFRLSSLVGEEKFDAIVSSLPLRNFAMEKREALIVDALSRLKPGAPFIQFSYGLAPPAPPPEGARVTLAARVWLNLPPAKVWVYRRSAPFVSP